jgi:hypothetical protein
MTPPERSSHTSGATAKPINKIPPDASSFANSWNGLTSRFAQSLAWDCTGVDPGAADLAKFFDKRHAFAKNPCGIRSANAGRSSADYN